MWHKSYSPGNSSNGIRLYSSTSVQNDSKNLHSSSLTHRTVILSSDMLAIHFLSPAGTVCLPWTKISFLHLNKRTLYSLATHFVVHDLDEHWKIKEVPLRSMDMTHIGICELVMLSAWFASLNSYTSPDILSNRIICFSFVCKYLQNWVTNSVLHL